MTSHVSAVAKPLLLLPIKQFGCKILNAYQQGPLFAAVGGLRRGANKVDASESNLLNAFGNGNGYSVSAFLYYRMR